MVFSQKNLFVTLNLFKRGAVMWRYFGQKSFRASEREYLEHLEAIARYITAINKVDHFKEKIKECRKRPNAYFGMINICD